MGCKNNVIVFAAQLILGNTGQRMVSTEKNQEAHTHTKKLRLTDIMYECGPSFARTFHLNKMLKALAFMNF